MIDLDALRTSGDEIRESLKKRASIKIDFDEILRLDARRRALITELEQLRRRRNETADEIGRLRQRKEDSTERQRQAGQLKGAIAALEAELQKAEVELHDRVAEVPNIPAADVPAGGKENNRVVKTWGVRPDVDSSIDHVAICTQLGLVDFERGTKLSGSGSWIYTGQGAALEWALLDFFCREHFAAGYTFLLPPHLLLEKCGFAAGQFPKFRDDVFHVQTDGAAKFLLPTAETAILSTYADEIIEATRLPIKAFAFTPCYRHEAGAYRTEERGTIRGHQFNKVEMFQFVAPEMAESALRELVSRAEGLVEKLGLHYRTCLLAAEDTSFSMAKTFDIEVWLPSVGKYKEVSSVSWAGDYQARRANIRYRPQAEKTTSLVHTLNGSGLATSRLVPAIVEQFRRPDGAVVVPEPLRPWLGTDLLERRSV